MQIKGCVYTDMGSRKRVNQDAVMLKVATSARYGRIAFAVLCDGMGGLDSGEIASGLVVKRFERWFHDELPGILKESEKREWERVEASKRVRVLTEVLASPTRRRAFAGTVISDAREVIRARWEEIVEEMNIRLTGYGRLHGIKLGTTLVCALLMGHEYLIMHVGDSRAYLADPVRLFQLTSDHTYAQYLMDEGLKSEEEAARVEDGALLMQCVGASCEVIPDFTSGTVDGETALLICSDGFWRRQDMHRLQKKMSLGMRASERRMESVLRALVRRVRKQGEDDDASVILLTCQ